MNKKSFIIGGAAVALVAIIVALIFVFTGGGDAYRSIKVFEIDGSCKVERGGDSLDAFKNMALSSGDSLTVGEGSFARLKLDDDKYVYLEANTKINLTATGTANDSKTMVYIERGSMLTEVKKKLSATSSYDIVTPNTTMSIRGTKTLTQVLEDAVTGHVQTSNAVLEGQVKIKAVKVKADGTVVSVEKDLGAGEGNAFSSSKEELVSQEEMKSIADTGASVNGIKVEIVSEEDADVVFDVATFEASFLENVKSILVADAEAASGEDGLSQEQIDAINAQLDEVLESFEVISTESQNAIDAATSGETDPEPTPEITPEPTPETTSESVWSWENIAVTETDDTQDEGTTIVDGDTNLIVIDDADEADDDTDEGVDEETDEAGTEDGDNDDTVGEDDGEVADDTDDDENAGEDDVDDADDEDGEEDSDDQSGEDDEEVDEESDEEDEDKEGTEEETTDEEEQSEKTTDEPSSTTDGQDSETTTTPGSGITDPNATDAHNGTQTSETTTQTVPVILESYAYAPGSSSSQSSSSQVGLVFTDVDGEPVSLPTSFAPGATLPSTSGTDIIVSVEDSYASSYEFSGWYSSPNPGSNDTPVTTVPQSASGTVTLYPVVRVKTYTVEFVNLFPEAGKLVIPTSGSSSITYETVDNRVIATVPANVDFTLPVPMNEDSSERNSVLHIEGADPLAFGINQTRPSFCGVGVGQSGIGDNINMGRLLLEVQKDRNDYFDTLADSFIGYSGDPQDLYNAPITLESDMIFYLYFGVSVKLQIRDYNSTVEMVKPDLQTEKIADALTTLGYDDDNPNAQIIRLRQDTNTEHSDAQKQAYDQYWLVNDRSDVAYEGYEEKVWEFTAFYFGKPLDVPSFELPVMGADYKAIYNVSGRELDPNFTSNIPYTNKPASGKSSAEISFYGSGTQLFPFNKYKDNAGQLQFYDISMYLDKLSYAILDLSETGLSVSLGDYYGQVIRTPGDSTDRLYEVIINRSGNDPYNAWVPEDGIYDWTAGGQTRSTTNDNSVASQFRVSKSGYRLAGYKVTSYNWTSGEVIDATQFCPVNETRAITSLGYTTNYTTSYDDAFQSALTTLGETLGKKYVVKPVFLPEGNLFEIEIDRKPGKIIKPTNGNAEWAISDYELTITGLKDLIDIGYPVTTIDLRSIRAKSFNLGRKNNEYYDIAFDKLLMWDEVHNEYDLYKEQGGGYVPAPNNVNPISYSLESDGTLKVPIAELADFVLHVDQNTNALTEFVRGIGFAEYTTPLNQYDIIQQFVSYEMNDLGFDGDDLDRGTDAGTATSFAEYKPCKRYVGIEANNGYKFTAVYSSNLNGPQLVFNESGSEPIASSGYLLQLLIGTDTFPGMAWYGGKITEVAYSSGMLSDSELAEIFPRTITRTDLASGSPEVVIKGGNSKWTGKYGSGVLLFSKYLSLSVTPDSDVKVYMYDADVTPRIGDDSINTEGLDEIHIKTLAQFYGSSLPQMPVKFSLVQDSDTSVPAGWAIVRDSGGDCYGYIYFGEANIVGKASASLSTDNP